MDRTPLPVLCCRGSKPPRRPIRSDPVRQQHEHLASRSPRHPSLSRRFALQAGAVGLLGLGIDHLATLRSAVASDDLALKNSPARSVIFIFLSGGLAQHDSFDPKPDAPEGIRGEFRPIATRTPGVHVCEHLPMLAARSHLWSMVRSLTHGTERPPRRDTTSCSPGGRIFPPASIPINRSRPTGPRSPPSSVPRQDRETTCLRRLSCRSGWFTTPVGSSQASSPARWVRAAIPGSSRHHPSTRPPMGRIPSTSSTIRIARGLPAGRSSRSPT